MTQTLFLVLCSKVIDLGFVVDFSFSIDTEIREVISQIALSFNIAGNETHFAYIPYSSFPGDYSALQWFNNSVVKSIQPQDRAAQKIYLDSVVKPDPAVNYTRGMVVGSSFMNILFYRNIYTN